MKQVSSPFRAFFLSLARHYHRLFSVLPPDAPETFEFATHFPLFFEFDVEVTGNGADRFRVWFGGDSFGVSDPEPGNSPPSVALPARPTLSASRRSWALVCLGRLSVLGAYNLGELRMAGVGQYGFYLLLYSLMFQSIHRATARGVALEGVAAKLSKLLRPLVSLLLRARWVLGALPPLLAKLVKPPVPYAVVAGGVTDRK
ncbi:MAG: hypothetical protein Kow0069_20120 [Promethearchaeota archaeon]